MPFAEFSREDAARVKEIERALERELMKFNQRGTEAALPIAALILCAKRLSNLYPEPRRSAIQDAIAMFMRGETPDQVIIPFETLLH